MPVPVFTPEHADPPLPGTPTSERGQQTAVDKALELLKSLAAHDREMGVSELARRAQLTKSTAFRLLRILQRNQLVARVGNNYRLGPQLFDIGSRVHGPTPQLIQERLLPHLVDLYELTRETVHLAVLHGTDILYLNKLHGHRAARLPSRIGALLPAYCTGVGKALLAFDHDAAEAAITEGLPARTEYTLSTPALLRDELRRIRQDGVAHDRQEFAPGLTCVAVPIMGPLGRPVAAFSVAGSDCGFDAARAAAALRRVAHTAARTITAAKALDASRQISRAGLGRPS
ncbi:IclR family transcriptional regulator [Streptomyces sp. NPDC002643]